MELVASSHLVCRARERSEKNYTVGEPTIINSQYTIKNYCYVGGHHVHDDVLYKDEKIFYCEREGDGATRDLLIKY